MATLNADNAEFPIAQYHDLTPLLHIVKKVLNCKYLQWALNDVFGLSVNCNLTSYVTVGAKEWYELVLIYTVIPRHHTQRPNYYLPLFSSWVSGPVHCFYMNGLFQSVQLSPIKIEKYETTSVDLIMSSSFRWCSKCI